MKQRNQFITMWNKAGARERYAMGHNQKSLAIYEENGHTLYKWTYPTDDPFQDANGATYDQTRGAWIN